MSACAVSRACAAARSPLSRGSAWSTTRSWSAALSAGCLLPSSTPLPVLFSSTTPSAPTLFNLAHAADGTSAGMRPRRRPSKRWTPRPGLQWVLDRFTAPAIVRNGRMDLLAVNHLGQAVHAALYDAAGGQPNFARFTFLNLEAAQDFYPDWDGAADTCVAILRTEAGRDPHDKDLHDLVGELSTRSEDFRRRWNAHNVRYHGAGTKHFHHHDVGDLELAYESVDMISEPGLTLTLYAAEPASRTAHALDLLGSWTTSPAAETRTPTT